MTFLLAWIVLRLFPWEMWWDHEEGTADIKKLLLPGAAETAVTTVRLLPAPLSGVNTRECVWLTPSHLQADGVRNFVSLSEAWMGKGMTSTHHPPNHQELMTQAVYAEDGDLSQHSAWGPVIPWSDYPCPWDWAVCSLQVTQMTLSSFYWYPRLSLIIPSWNFKSFKIKLILGRWSLNMDCTAQFSTGLFLSYTGRHRSRYRGANFSLFWFQAPYV